jgi:Fe-S-cluster-containing dehydrogenase component/formate-dependent nitrite reductase membrane component NrfD
VTAVEPVTRPYLTPAERAAASPPTPQWVKVIDQTRCIGCHACTTACKSENGVPVGVTRTYVKAVEVGRYPQVRRAFQVTRCNQCANPPCVAACPTGAMFRRADGIVDFDKRLCIGCKACIAACPYDAIFINPEDHAAEKCNFCAHRIDIGLEPACVVVCPTEAILVGDLNDPTSKVAAIVQRQPVSVRRPEKKTHPKLYYKGAHQNTLDPLAARRPSGRLFAWATQGPSDPLAVTSGHPEGASEPGHDGGHNSSAAALLAYDVPHRAPWGWRVSLYTWTKGVAAGAYLVAGLLVVLGLLGAGSRLFAWAAPAISLGFLGVTGVLLIADLKRPFRFYLIFTRHRPQSWLVIGSFVIAAYGAVVTAGLLTGLLGARLGSRVLLGPGLPLAVMAACYTAFLFAQGKARDAWQSPLLPVLLGVQALLLGASALWPVAVALGVPGVDHALGVLLGASAAVVLVAALAETRLGHVTAHVHLVTYEMTRGRFAATFWIGVVLLAAAVAAPWIGVVAALPAALGLLAYEHAFVQASQAVPLA